MSNTKYAEKTSYLGELRILGRVFAQAKDPVGYIVMKEDTKDMTAYNVAQVQQLLTRYKFVNAALSGYNIVNTECSMDKLPNFNVQLKCVTPNKVTILSKVFDTNNKHLGYKVWLCGDDVIDLTENDIFNLINRGYELVNAKVVSQGATQYISAIKKEFTKTVRKEVQQEPKSNISPQKAWRLNCRGNKLYNNMILYIFTDYLVYNFVRPSSYVKIRQNGETYLMPKTDVQLMIKAAKKNDDGSRAELISKVEEYIKTMDLSETTQGNKKLTDNDIVAYILAGQFTKYLGYALRKTSGWKMHNLHSKSYAEIKKVKDLLVPDLQSLIGQMYKATKEFQEKRNSKKGKTHEMGSVNFKNERTLHEMGFTIKESEDGQKYQTANSYNYSLHYIGKDIQLVSPEQLKELFKGANVFGDMCVLGQVDKYLRQSEFRLAEICLGYMSIYNYDLAKKYIDMVSGQYPQLNMMIPNGADASKFADNGDFKVYYESGFNVYKDSETGNYVNYRAKYSSYTPIESKSFDKLVPILKAIVSEDVNSEYIRKNIGTLRHI